MAKCAVCKQNIATTFLGKLIGTYIKDEKGKRHTVCFECQKKLKTKDAIIRSI
ncbi:MAG: hypothetical protein HGA85_06520 [Nanoarchaeota archaeon]|nr:hypothetical protein [Nanoarchaeota archaeon]